MIGKGQRETEIPFDPAEWVLRAGGWRVLRTVQDPSPEGASELEDLLHFAQDFNGSEDLGDDFSITKMTI
jgi:hypothetical protein